MCHIAASRLAAILGGTEGGRGRRVQKEAEAEGYRRRQRQKGTEGGRGRRYVFFRRKVHQSYGLGGI